MSSNYETESVADPDPESSTPGATATATAQVGGFGGKQRSLTGDAWLELRRSPMFIFSGAIIVLMVTIALFPGLFTSIDAHDKQTYPCLLSNSRKPPSADHWFGFDLQGCDYYSRVIYGARPSITIGILVVLFSVIIALLIGTTSGYYGGFLDSLFSRITDIFFGIPFILGAIVFLSAIQGFRLFGVQFEGGVSTVVVALTVFGWTTLTRLMRSSVLSARDMDYVQAARALGASNLRIMIRHILPNAITPVVVYGTVSVGLIIAAEAALSFLGVGLRPPAISWGLMISESQRWITATPHLLLFPGLFLSATVLAFLMLGDAVRDAFDPKLR
jgi:oligopeptide transport system permease protein